MLGSERATAPSFPRRQADVRSYMPAGCRLAARSAGIQSQPACQYAASFGSSRAVASRTLDAVPLDSSI